MPALHLCSLYAYSLLLSLPGMFPSVVGIMTIAVQRNVVVLNIECSWFLSILEEFPFIDGTGLIFVIRIPLAPNNVCFD